MNTIQEMQARLEGLTMLVLALTAQLQMRGNLDGADFCNRLRGLALDRGKKAELAPSSDVIRDLAHWMDQARATRQTGAG